MELLKTLLTLLLVHLIPVKSSCCLFLSIELGTVKNFFISERGSKSFGFDKLSHKILNNLSSILRAYDHCSNGLGLLILFMGKQVM